MPYKILLLHYQIQQAGLPVVGVSAATSQTPTSSPSEYYTGPQGLVRVDYSRALQPAETASAQSVVNAHDPSALLPIEQDDADEVSAKTAFRSLPNYATWSPQETQDNITNMILSGKTKAQVDADIAALPATIAGMKTGLTTLADAVIDTRTVLALIGKMITYLRQIAVRHT